MARRRHRAAGSPVLRRRPIEPRYGAGAEAFVGFAALLLALAPLFDLVRRDLTIAWALLVPALVERARRSRDAGALAPCERRSRARSWRADLSARQRRRKIRAMRVGVVSDTHGLLRPEVPELLAGCDAILHAGDVGGEDVLARLGEVAPVTAVRGNVDLVGAPARLPEVVEGDLEGLAYRMTHLREDALAAGTDRLRLVVYGHSHRPEIGWHGECLLLNPGACGRRRFTLPLTVAWLTVGDGRIVPELLAVG